MAQRVGLGADGKLSAADCYDGIGLEAPWRGCIQLFGRHGAQSCDGRVALLMSEGEAARSGFFETLGWSVFAIPDGAAFPCIQRTKRKNQGQKKSGISQMAATVQQSLSTFGQHDDYFILPTTSTLDSNIVILQSVLKFDFTIPGGLRPKAVI